MAILMGLDQSSRIYPENTARFFILIALAGVIPAGFGFLSAVLAKKYDRAAFITTLVPAAALFVANYAWGIHEFGYREPNTFYNVMGGPAHPFDPIGQTLQILFSSVWAAAVAFVAIVLKRSFFAVCGLDCLQDQKAEEPENLRAFSMTVLALIAACVVGLVAFTGYTSFENMPEQRVAKSARILDSPSSTTSERRWAWRQLWRIPSQESNAVLAKAAANQPPPRDVLAACLLASHNDISYLALAEKTLMQPVLPGEKEFSLNPGSLLEAIGDIQAAPILARLMKSPDPQIRLGASQALRHMDTKESVEALIGGLNDPEWEVRWRSVLGLAEIIGSKHGNSWHPDMNTFKAEEKKYLDHWNAWAASRLRPVEAK
ncbi:MAG: HEAT repeat domain-containing protein [bacterium]